MKKIRKNRHGFTLVEAIVSFGLTAVFITAATMVLSVFMRTYQQVNSMASAQTVGGTLMEQIVSELESSAEVNVASYAELSGEGYTALTLVDGGNSVWYANYDRQIIHMYAEDGELVLEYQSTETNPEKTLWKYPEEFYNDCVIQSLQIEKRERNLLNVTLEICHVPSGSVYTTSRMLECYNLEENQMKQKDASS